MHLSDYTVDNPVLKREMRARLRPRVLRGNPSLTYGVYALCACIVYAYVKGVALMFHGPPSDARDLFQMLTWILLILVSIIAPALSATAISQEREQQTWEILAVTRITAGQVILGKWLGRQLILVIGFVILLPFTLGSAIHAGIAPESALDCFVFLALCANFFTALGLLCSSRAKRTPTATAFALVTTAVLCIGSLVVNSIVESFGLWNASANAVGGYVETPIMWINPYYAMAEGSDLWFSSGSSNHAADTTVVVMCVAFMVFFSAATAFSLIRRFRDNRP